VSDESPNKVDTATVLSLEPVATIIPTLLLLLFSVLLSSTSMAKMPLVCNSFLLLVERRKSCLGAPVCTETVVKSHKHTHPSLAAVRSRDGVGVEDELFVLEPPDTKRASAIQRPPCAFQERTGSILGGSSSFSSLLGVLVDLVDEVRLVQEDGQSQRATMPAFPAATNQDDVPFPVLGGRRDSGRNCRE
jgi:hypothetical protein